MAAGGFREAFGRAHDSRLAAAIVRVLRRRADEPQFIEQLLDRPSWALADKLRRVTDAVPLLEWWVRVLARLCKHEPNWTQITEAVRGLLIDSRPPTATARATSN